MPKKLSPKQLARLSEFTSNFGLIFAASVIGPFFSGFDKINPFLILLGTALSTFCLVTSLWLVKK